MGNTATIAQRTGASEERPSYLTRREAYNAIIAANRMQKLPTFARIDDINGRLAYVPARFEPRSMHYGQMKLFLSEVQFLTNFARDIAPFPRETYVIYAGSGPGHTRQILADMFPGIHFILIDPQAHDIRITPQSGVRSPAIFYHISTDVPSDDTMANDLVHVASLSADGEVSIDREHPRSHAISRPITCAQQLASTIFDHPEYTFHIIEDLFTDDLARAFGEQSRSRKISLFFISDIRTIFVRAIVDQTLRKTDPNRSIRPSDLDILLNNATQHIWAYYLQPRAALLKFRPPFMNPADRQIVDRFARSDPTYKEIIARYNELFGVNILEDYARGIYRYLAPSHIDLQVFARHSSTETRHVTIGENVWTKIATIDPRNHESALAYYNAVRECAYYPNYLQLQDRSKGETQNALRTEVRSGEAQNALQPLARGFDGCHDCTRMMEIMLNYTKTFNKSPNLAINIIRDVVRALSREFDVNHHGHAFAPYLDADQLLTEQKTRHYCPRKIGGKSKLKDSKLKHRRTNNREMAANYFPSLESAITFAKNRAPTDPIYVRVTDIDRRVRYQRTPDKIDSLHYGQMKLFLSVMQFLEGYMSHISVSADDAPIIWLIYAGSAPGNAHNILAREWPNVRFILVDPASHDIYDAPRDKLLYYRITTNGHSRYTRNSAEMGETVHVAQVGGEIIRDHPRTSRIANPIEDWREVVTTIFDHPEYTFHIIEDFFTDDLAHALGEKSRANAHLLFVSDIRTKVGGGIRNLIACNVDTSPSDMDILANNASQHIWTHYINPRASMLKFRTPFMNPQDIRMVNAYRRDPSVRAIFTKYRELFDVDILAEYRQKRYVYLRPSHINVQAFAGSSSTESRHVTYADDNPRFIQCATFDNHDWEDAFIYLNMIRGFTFFAHDCLDEALGIDGCHDCALMMHILKLCTHGDNSRAIGIVRDLTTLLNRSLKRENHGMRFAKNREISAPIKE